MPAIAVKPGKMRDLGEYIWNAVNDPVKRAALLSKPTDELQPYCQPFGANQRIVVIPETDDDVRVMKLPYDDDLYIEVAGARVKGNKADATHQAALNALWDAIGGYILKNCR